MPTPSFLDRAGRWFLSSGIQEPQGGVARYYRSDLGRNNPVSTEITGYAASTLVYLHSRTGEEQYLNRAIETARYLVSAWDDKLQCIPFEYPVNGKVYAYFFDSGIIVRGLLAVWRASGEGEFLACARACAVSMSHFAAGPEFHPILQLPAKQPIERDERWSRSPGCYQLKSAMAWQDLYEATGDSCFRQWYLAARDRALASHRCFIPGHHDPERVMDRLHAYAYFLEGLLPCAGERDVAAAMREGVGTLARYLNEISPCFARSDVYAQLLRLRIYAEWLGVLAVDHAAARHEAEQLAAFQLSDADPRIEGGFAFGRRQGQLMPYVNPVSAGFGLQALALWRDYCAGMRQAHRHLLI